MMVIAMLMTGCGNDVAINANEKDNAESVATSNISNTSEATENSEDNVSDIPEKDTESSINEELEGLNLKEYKDSFEDRNIDTSGSIAFPFEKFEACGDVFYLTDSINLYIDNGSCIGYTKPNIEIIAVMEYEGWYYIDVSGMPRFVKASDVEAVGTEQEYPETTTPPTPDSAPTSDTTPIAPPPVSNKPETQKVDSTPTDNSAEVIQTSDKYTPEEAISVYRSLMEAGGMTWTPSLKGNWDETIGQYPIEEWNLHMDGYNGGSWGTGWLELDKEYVEWAASTDLESCAMGDSVGNPRTKYYLEVTGSDDECVYFTMWSD